METKATNVGIERIREEKAANGTRLAIRERRTPAGNQVGRGTP